MYGRVTVYCAGRGPGVLHTWHAAPQRQNRHYLDFQDADNWHFDDEDKVLAAVATHEAKMNNLKNSSPAKTPMKVKNDM